jgi:hypothetical protein
MSTPKPAIRAMLIGSNRCDAAGFIVCGRAPVTMLCRILLEAGYDSGRPLHAYRGDVLSLRIRTIGEGARLTVKNAGSGCPVFAPAEGAAAPVVRKSAPPLGNNTNMSQASRDDDAHAAK